MGSCALKHCQSRVSRTCLLGEGLPALQQESAWYTDTHDHHSRAGVAFQCLIGLRKGAHEGVKHRVEKLRPAESWPLDGERICW